MWSISSAVFSAGVRRWESGECHEAVLAMAPLPTVGTASIICCSEISSGALRDSARKRSCDNLSMFRSAEQFHNASDPYEQSASFGPKKQISLKFSSRRSTKDFHLAPGPKCGSLRA